MVLPVTLPKMVFFLLSSSHLSSVIKNCEPLSFGPPFAHPTWPRWLYLRSSKDVRCEPV